MRCVLSPGLTKARALRQPVGGALSVRCATVVADNPACRAQATSVPSYPSLLGGKGVAGLNHVDPTFEFAGQKPYRGMLMRPLERSRGPAGQGVPDTRWACGARLMGVPPLTLCIHPYALLVRHPREALSP